VGNLDPPMVRTVPSTDTKSPIKEEQSSKVLQRSHSPSLSASSQIDWIESPKPSSPQNNNNNNMNTESTDYIPNATTVPQSLFQKSPYPNQLSPTKFKSNQHSETLTENPPYQINDKLTFSEKTKRSISGLLGSKKNNYKNLDDIENSEFDEESENYNPEKGKEKIVTEGGEIDSSDSRKVSDGEKIPYSFVQT